MPPPKLYEFTQYITPDGEIYRFNTGTDKFLISEAGMGMPPVRYITQGGPYQPGEVLLDYRLQTRVIQLVHRKNSCGRQAYWDSRNTLLDMIRPNRSAVGTMQLGVLRKILPDGDQRDIDVIIEQGPEFAARNPQQWDEWSFTETLRFVAHNPTFYDPVQLSSAWSLAEFSQLQFAFSFPLTFESDYLGASLAVDYPGTWESYPDIVIVGPLDGPRVVNETTGDEIDLNYTVSIGETVTIYLNPGHKHAESDLYGDLTGLLRGNFSTFSLVPSPNNNNTVTVTGGGGNIAITTVTLKYYVRYIGI
jgi:hypothetical protein